MCFRFQAKQLLSNYDNSLFKNNFIENTTPLFRDVNFLSCANFLSIIFMFFFPCHSSRIQPLNTRQSAPSPKTLPHPPPLIHIPTNTHLRLISSHTHTTLPPTHPTQHLWLITSKEDAIRPKGDPLRQIPAGTQTAPIWQARQTL